MESLRSQQGHVVLMFLVVVLIGSGNFIAVSFSNRELDPFWGAALRFGLAALLFVVIALAMRLEWPTGRTLAMTAAYGLFTFTLSYALLYWALTQVSAGLTAVVLATVPLTTALLAAAQGLEPLNRRGLIGAVVALGGIVWMATEANGADIPLGAVVATLAASVTMGESVILSKRVAGNHPAMNNAVGMLVGAPLLFGLSLAFGEDIVLPVEPPTIVAVAYLVIFGSVGLFILTLLVVRLWTAAATSYMFVLFPVGALLLDALFTGAPLTLRNVSGAIIVMASVWFGAVAPAHRATTPVPSGHRGV